MASQVTAQDVFKTMMRDFIAPALRDLGFRRRRAHEYAVRRGEHEGYFRTDKSHRNTRREVDFRVLLWQVHVPTCTSYRDRDLFALIPRSENIWWTVGPDTPSAPVADEVVTAFRQYGWPAIQAAVDSPGEPPDPGIVWQRRFPPVPADSDRHAMDSIDALIDAGLVTEGLLAQLEVGNCHYRRDAARQLCLDAFDDPQVLPALLRHLELDRSPQVRAAVAEYLRPAAGQPAVLSAMRSAAAQDEDAQVRWAARYAQM
jgi:hypothetical protein